MVNGGNPNSTRKTGSLSVAPRFPPQRNPGSEHLAKDPSICGTEPSRLDKEIVLPPAWLILRQVSPKYGYMYVSGNNFSTMCSGPLCLYGHILRFF